MNEKTAISQNKEAGQKPASSCLWVIAACNGMVSLFERGNNGKLYALTGMDYTQPGSLPECLRLLTQAESLGELTQCILVGSASDIAWMQVLLPPSIQKKIRADIEYPIIASLFKQAQRDNGMHELLSILERLLV